MDLHKTEAPVEDDIVELVPFFVKSREADLLKLKSLFEEKNYPDMARISHTIKGISRPYGFPSLESLARELEDACKKSDAKTIQGQITQIETYLMPYLTQ